MNHYLFKYLAVSIGVIICYSCSNDDLDISHIHNKPDDIFKNNKEQVNFSAATSNAIGTYTQLQNDYSVIWEGTDLYPSSPDEIGVFTEGLLEDASNLKLWALNSGKTSMFDYEGELKWGDLGQTFYAYGPYSAGSSINSVQGNLPHRYLQVKAGSINHIKHIDFIYAMNNISQIPSNKRVPLEFNHLFSIVELSISGTFNEATADNFNLFFGKILTQIDVRLVNNETGETLPIAGDFNVDLKTIKTLENGSLMPPKTTWSNPKDMITIFLPGVDSPDAILINNTPKKIFFVIGNTDYQDLSGYSLEIIYHISTPDGESLINGVSNFTSVKINNRRNASNIKAGKYFTSQIDLQLYEASNCYMVYKPGDFAFFANRPGANNTNANAIRHYQNIDLYGPSTVNPSALVPGIKSVDWLWSDARDLRGNGVASSTNNALISGLNISEQGVISFRKNDTYTYGNVIIAAFDKKPSDPDYEDRKILWTWHIWCPYGKPKIITIQSGALDASGNLTAPFENYMFLDRNVGAIMEASDNSSYNSLNLGLYYQWGRKDPFVGGRNSGTSLKPSSWPLEKSFCAVNFKHTFMGTFKQVNLNNYTSYYNIGYTVKNPTSFIYDGNKWGWRGDLYSLGSISQYKSAEIGMWDTEKTLFDPCPYGYYLPNRNAFNWIVDQYTTKRYTSTGEGSNYFMHYNEYADYLDNKLSFPLAGFISSQVPNAFWAYNVTYVWTSSSAIRGAGWNELTLYNNNEKINSPYVSSFGDQVRCVRLPKK